MNAEVLTTPHDIHATILDALQMQEHMNTYKIKGADLTRGLSLFQPIPSSRSCSEAGVAAHWCSCLTWRAVGPLAPQYAQAARSFVTYINTLTEPVRDVCERRTLTHIHWVMVQEANNKLMRFSGASDGDGFIGNFDGAVTKTRDNFQIKVTVGPGKGVFEATGAYIIDENKFIFNAIDVSRTNSYKDEAHCISDTHPHLNMFCFCRPVRYSGRRGT